MMTEGHSTRPVPVASAITLVLGITAAMIVFAVDPLGGMIALAGLCCLLVGLLRPRPGLLSLGSFGIGLGVLLVGLFGADPIPLVVATMATILSWDTAHNAASLGRQLGTAADPTIPAIAHLSGGLVAGGITAGLSIGIYQAISGGYTSTAVALCGLAGLCIVAALR